MRVKEVSRKRQKLSPFSVFQDAISIAQGDITPKSTLDTTKIPVKLTQEEFEEFIFPHLSLAKRGPRCKIGYHKLFNSILKVLHTGMQWSELTIDKDAYGQPEIHYTGIFKVYARWARDGSIDNIFKGSVSRLKQNDKLDLSV